MGQTVYVLSTIIEGGENRPVAVVTNEFTAEQWIQSGNNNDWIPFELDDISTTAIAKDHVTPFVPKKPTPSEQAVQDTMNQLVQANKKLMEAVELLQAKLDKTNKAQKRKGGSENPLLKKTESEYDED